MQGALHRFPPLSRLASFSALRNRTYSSMKAQEEEENDQKLLEEVESCLVEEISRKLFESKVVVRAKHVSLALQRLISAKHSRAAHDLIHHLPSWNIKPSIKFYTTLLQSVLEQDNVDLQQVEQIHSIVTSSLTPDLFYFTKIAKIYGHIGDFRLITEIQMEMEQLNILPDIIFYNVLIDSLTRYNKIDEAREVLSSMISVDQADELSFAPLLAHSFSIGDQKAVEVLFADMKNHDILPSLNIFKRMLLIVKGNLRQVRTLLSAMEEMGVTPDTFLCNSLLEIYIHQKKISNARDLLKKMKKLEIEPNISSYNIMLTGYTHEGDRIGFRRILDEMESQGIEPDIRSMNSALKLSLLRGEYTKTIQTIQDMKNKSMLLDQYSIMYLFEALGCLGDVRPVQMEMANLRVNRPESITNRVFTAYLVALASCNQWNDVVLEIEETFRAQKLNITLWTFTSLLELSFSCQKWDAFDKIVELHSEVLPLSANGKLNSLVSRRKVMLRKNRVVRNRKAKRPFTTSK